jgi:hypothetical protein
MHQEKTDTRKPSSLLDSSFTIIYLTVILTSLLISLIAVRDEVLGMFLTSEDSPVQIFSVIGYFMAIITAVFLQWKKRLSFGYGAAVIFLAMALRELDFHDRFTTMGIMKTRFYISATVPPTEKIIGAVILVALACIIVLFLVKNFQPFLAALRDKNRAALLALNGICFTIISKIIDPNPSLIACAIEETMEFAIPYFFLSAMLLYVKLEKENN